MKEFFKRVGKSEIQNILGVIVVVGCFVLLYLMLMKPIPAENREVLNIAVGFIFGGALAGVIGFYFGASKQPVNKDQNPQNTP
ncbi:hypothetical protein [Pinibacter soli]|uniref:Uncharacterized protein n=1 Tax=Pinibacter soli TaxID=3044211 RepID=A0ABT6RBW8_9BACT|nr:hypothetical protein [Pinibacter soli]MDI3320008.1 hypothetical protein [Pinibacter soli]